MVLVASADDPFERRAARFDTTDLPVPADLSVYTLVDWEAARRGPGFVRTAAGEVVCVWSGDGFPRAMPSRRRSLPWTHEVGAGDAAR